MADQQQTNIQSMITLILIEIKCIESLRPLQGRHGGLPFSHFQAHHDAPPTLKPNLIIRNIKNKDRLLI